MESLRTIKIRAALKNQCLDCGHLRKSKHIFKGEKIDCPYCDRGFDLSLNALATCSQCNKGL